MKKDIRVLKDLKPAGPLQTQATKEGPAILGLEGLSVRAANCLRRMKPSLDTRAAVLAAMLIGKIHPNNVECLNLGWATYREVRKWLGRELFVSDLRAMISRGGMLARLDGKPREAHLVVLMMDSHDADLVKQFLARLAVGDPPDANSLKPMLMGIANVWDWEAMDGRGA